MAPSLLHLALALDCFGGILYLLFAPRILYWLGQDGELLVLPMALYAVAPIIRRYQGK